MRGVADARSYRPRGGGVPGNSEHLSGEEADPLPGGPCMPGVGT